MTTAEVHACERCLTRPAVMYDTYADEVSCRNCGGDPDTSYGCQFLLSYIPRDLPVTSPARPTIEVEVEFVTRDAAQVRMDDIAAERAERRAKWWWPCGCLRNDADANRVGCPEYPEGRRGDR